MQFAQANAQTKIAKELALPTQTKIVFKKFPNASKKIKIHRLTARQMQQTMTRKLNIDNAYNDTMDRRQLVTAVAVAQLLFLENSFEKHNI